MKKHKFAVLSVCVMLVMLISAGFAAAADDPKPQPNIKNRTISPPTQRRAGRTGDTRQRDRRQLQKIDEEIKRKQGELRKHIAELKSIKELALAENATKTAKRLEILIRQKEAESAEAVSAVKARRDRAREQISAKRTSAATQQKKPSEKPKEPAKEDAEKSKGGSWWKFWK